LCVVLCTSIFSFFFNTTPPPSRPLFHPPMGGPVFFFFFFYNKLRFIFRFSKAKGVTATKERQDPTGLFLFVSGLGLVGFALGLVWLLLASLSGALLLLGAVLGAVLLLLSTFSSTLTSFLRLARVLLA